MTPASPGLAAVTAAEIDRLWARFPDRRAAFDARELRAFRDLYASLGVARARARPSLERLLARALERGVVPPINNVVDVYNLVALRWLVSLGAHDAETLALPVTLALAQGRETYVPLGRREPETLGPGEFLYADAAGRVICRLDAHQAEFSKVTPRTRRLVMIIEGTAAHDARTLEAAFGDATGLMATYCGAAPEVVVGIAGGPAADPARRA